MSNPDLHVMAWVADHRFGWITRLSELLMSASADLVVLGVLAVLSLIYVARQHQWPAAAAVAAAAVAAVVVAGVLKALIGRSRPPADLALVHASGFSMPSTDGALTAAAALAFYLTANWSTRRARRAVALGLSVLVLLIGLCLIYLGAHWPSDVLAGWVVGALAGWSCHLAVTWAIRGRARPSVAR